jgi:hypothetical protein
MSSTLGYSEFNDNNDDSSDQDNILNQRRHARTQKRRECFVTNKPGQNKLNPAILEQMHNMNNDDDQDDASIFPPNPQSSGTDKTKEKENLQQNQKTESMVNMSNDTIFRTLGSAAQPSDEEINNLELNDYKNYGDEKSNVEYYKRILPGYSEQIKKQNLVNKPYYNHVNYQMPSSDESILLKKMNYMITLLEDQQDERTNNVTEEVILYSFLGIFIIFIADTFVRAGKYVR